MTQGITLPKSYPEIMIRKLPVLLVSLLMAVIPASAPASFLNLSTRVDIPAPGLGDDVTAVIGGFIIAGNNGRKILVRALGPSLTDFGLDPLRDPVLELHDSTGAIIATNDNWRDTQESEIEATHLAPNDGLEPAIVITIPPGSYTAIVRGNGSDPGAGAGTTLIEIYDISISIGKGLDNISTRGAVHLGDNPMILGFVIANGGDQTVVVRGLGPSLKDLGLAGLTDPRLDLFDSDGNVIASNDNWQETQASDIEATGLAPGDPLEPAILITLPRGSYTAILSPVSATEHGVALAELYKL
jgi:hypothetical protein